MPSSGDSRSSAGLGIGGILLGLGLLAALVFLPGTAEAKRMPTKKGPRDEPGIRRAADKWAPVFGIPSDWIVAISKIETGFYPGAVNLTGGDLKRGGAWGPMQVTLETAKGIAARLRARAGAEPIIAEGIGRWRGTGAELGDPDLGVMFGAELLGYLAKQFGQRFDLVSAAYNRGAGAVRKMIAEGKLPGAIAYAQKALEAQRTV